MAPPMYRHLIQAAAFIPPAIVKHLDVSGGFDQGRLYCIVPEDFERRPQPRLSRASTWELVALLEHPHTRVQLSLVHNHRLHGIVVRLVSQTSTIDPFSAPGEAEYRGFVFRMVGIGDPAIKISVEGNQSGNQRVGRAGLTVVRPAAKIAIVDAELGMPRIRHRVAHRSIAGKIKAETISASFLVV